MKFKRIHCWNITPKDAIELQKNLSKEVIIAKFQIKPTLIAGTDVSFRDGMAYGVVVILSYPELKIVEAIKKIEKISYPYVPGLLSFRECPILEKCFLELKNEFDLILVDGQGIAHPRKFGIASHLGYLLDKPSIGCAKSHLFGNFEEPGVKKGSFAYIFDQEKNKIGVVLRTRDNVKPVYVSCGYKVDIATSIRIILSCTSKYRIPEPLRVAHHLSKL